MVRSPYIARGYKPVTCRRDVLIELVKMESNEAGNMWMTIIRFASLAVVWIYVWQTDERVVQVKQRHGRLSDETSPLIALFVSILVQFVASFVAHATSNASRELYQRWRRADFIACFAMYALHTYAMSYFVLTELTTSALCYLSISLCVVMGVFTAQYDFSMAEMRREIALSVALARGINVVPIAIQVTREWRMETIPLIPSICLFGICVSHLCGLLAYAYFLPESLFPGSFDIIGQSQQIWYLCQIPAALCEYIFVLHVM